ncbi:hypothetical protein GQX74_005449 [Glossina fuscipes]|nr:hypothetical protein GQX74_005449 [Glossina fuscipes]
MEDMNTLMRIGTVEPIEDKNTKAKPPSGNIPCATPENPISSAPSIIVSRVQPDVGTCGKAASSILIRMAFTLVSFESSEDSLIFSRSRSSNSSSLFCSRSLNSSNPGFTGSLGVLEQKCRW